MAKVRFLFPSSFIVILCGFFDFCIVEASMLYTICLNLVTNFIAFIARLAVFKFGLLHL